MSSNPINQYQQPVIYSDFPNNFNKSPFSKDLAVMTNEDSIKQSLKNIVLTIIEERPYDNTIGSSGKYGLFELNDGLASIIAKEVIQDAIRKNEPRVNLVGVNVNDVPNNNYYSISIYFNVANIPGTQNINISIKRVR